MLRFGTSFRLSNVALMILQNKAKELGLSKTAVIEMALRTLPEIKTEGIDKIKEISQKLRKQYDRACETCGEMIMLSTCPPGPWEGGEALKHPVNSCKWSGSWFVALPHDESGYSGLVLLPIGEWYDAFGKCVNLKRKEGLK